MPERVGTLLADVSYWVRTNRALSLLAVAVAIVVVVTIYVLDRHAPPVDPETRQESSFDPEVFDRFKVGKSASTLEEDLGAPDYTDHGERATAMAWVLDRLEYYVITRRGRIVSRGVLPCDDHDASAC